MVLQGDVMRVVGHSLRSTEIVFKFSEGSDDNSSGSIIFIRHQVHWVAFGSLCPEAKMKMGTNESKTPEFIKILENIDPSSGCCVRTSKRLF